MYPFPTFDFGLKGSNGRAMKVLTVVFFHLFGCSISNFDCSNVSLTRHISKALQQFCPAETCARKLPGSVHSEPRHGDQGGVPPQRLLKQGVQVSPNKSYVPKYLTENHVFLGM